MLGNSDVTSEELIDRLVLEYRNLTQDQITVLGLALVARGILAAQSMGVKAFLVQVGELGEIDDAWIDTGCDCPRCTDQRQLREAGKGKPN